MRYRVIVTVDVEARDAKEAEREAMKALVSDLAGWSRDTVDVQVLDDDE